VKVVIIGGGFGGLNAAKSISKLPVEITLMDRRNFHLFQPLLYQVATGGLSPGDIAAPLRSVLSHYKNVTVLLEEAARIDPNAREVVTGNTTVPYDILILATGAQDQYYGHSEWAQFAPPLKTIEDAIEIRRRILVAFENAENEPDPVKRREWLKFVVVGGGPTGVELSGAIAEIANDTLRGNFRRIRPEEAEILLLDGTNRVLPTFHPDLSEHAERSLIKLGVRTRTGVRVTCIDEEGVKVQSANGEEHIRAKTVLWAAGVQVSSIARQLGQALHAETDRMGRIKVGPDLSIPGHPEILVIGDIALCVEKGEALPGMCPVAMQQGWFTAKAVQATLEGKPRPQFHYWNKGIMATIGRKAAVADLGWIRFGGLLAWLAWLFIHLLYLVSHRSKVMVAIQWAFQYFTFNRGARLITTPWHTPQCD
jgi:NADH:ubiquinone reductase (H+-translocating)